MEVQGTWVRMRDGTGTFVPNDGLVAFINENSSRIAMPLREDVGIFSRAMEERMQKNEGRGGQEMSTLDLFARINRNALKVQDAVTGLDYETGRVREDLVDLANWLMILYGRLGQ